MHFSNEKWKHKPQQLARSLTGRLEKSCKFSSAAQEQPLFWSSSPHERCLGLLKDTRPCLQLTLKRFQSTGTHITQTKICILLDTGNEEHKTQQKSSFLGWKCNTRAFPRLLYGKVELSDAARPLNRTVLPLHTACMLNSADKGIYFHIFGEYQYLSFRKKKVKDNSLPDARMMNLQWKKPFE